MAQLFLFPHAPDQMEPLADLVATHEQWLMARILEYAKLLGYTRYTSTLVKAWQISISGLSASLLAALRSQEGVPELGPDEDYTRDPIAAFGVLEAQRHRARGVTLGMFLGLMKYYRQSYIDLVVSVDLSPGDRAGYRYILDRFFDRVNMENSDTDIECELKTAEGPRHFQITVKKMRDVSEKFSGTVVILKDITRRIRAETQLKTYSDHLETLVAARTSELVNTNAILRKEIEERERTETANEELHQQLLHSQKMEAIGTMAGGIAHDFNNILSAILGFSELAQESLPARSAISEHLKEIIVASLRAKQLVMQILAFSYRDSQQQKPVKLDIIVREVLKLFRAMIPASIQIRQNIEADCGYVLMAPTYIHQILMNLCANAYHAMKETGGVLSICLKATMTDEDGKEKEFGLIPGPYLMLSVSDTGHGMDDAVREKIFEPYFTTKKQGEGTGLGLSVISGIIKKHQGYIHVFSEPGEGASFHIYFPRAAGEERAFETDVSEPLPRGSEHLLIVDDEAVLAGMWQQHLELLGYRVTACTSSQAAIQNFKSQPEAFDLVLTDMNMPNITGNKLSRMLMEIRPDIPIILSTGYDETMTEKEAMASGIKAFILKPVQIRDLARTIRKVLEKKTVFHQGGGNPASNFAQGGR
jgi:signal transduction histidine kinase/ActR/RegA family two-component response regulator